ncbi:UNVERIFIED_CONTAM: hypothetical protein NCL1_19751 [Trichonephila clavipes]
MMFSVVSRTLLIVALVCISLSCYEARPADDDAVTDAPGDSAPDSTATTAADGGADGTGTAADSGSTPAAGDGTTGDAAGSTAADDTATPTDAPAPEERRR